MNQNIIPDKVWADIAKACDVIGQSGQGAEELGYALDRLTNAVMGETPPVPVPAQADHMLLQLLREAVPGVTYLARTANVGVPQWDDWARRVREVIQNAPLPGSSGDPQMYKLALQEFLDKTEWVQKTGKGHELGMHRADVLRQRIEVLQAEKDVTQEALDDAKGQITQLQTLLDGLRDLCGYVENGSDTVVRISQDDATKDWVVTLGHHLRPKSAHGSSMVAALKSAIEKFGGES